MGHLFIGNAVNSGSKPPTSDDVDVGAPNLCSYDLFFSNDIFGNLEADTFYNTVETLHKNGTLTNDTKAKKPGDESSPSNHPGN